MTATKKKTATKRKRAPNRRPRVPYVPTPPPPPPARFCLRCDAECGTTDDPRPYRCTMCGFDNPGMREYAARAAIVQLMIDRAAAADRCPHCGRGGKP